MASRPSPQARRLEKALRERLRTACDIGDLATTVAEMLGLLQIASNGADEVIQVPRDSRNFRRDRGLPHFARSDGAWFDFGITLRKGQIIAWSFEIRFPDTWKDGPGWARFDLNPPGHANEARGLRSHLHLGSDDDGMSIPYTASFVSPGEDVTADDAVAMLDLLLTGMRKTGRQRDIAAVST
ncbi:MAG: hypothetical protein H6736_12040 [Alphaproteobacteria bacterium]|nr:hypothetical protein [Alphaproteobacteria bacterium]MCB9692535.1 hypothetical protein [Alphaproteobacteria bacterium]